MASSSSIGGLASGWGTLGALVVGVESLAGPPTYWNKSSGDTSRMISSVISSISMLVVSIILDSEKHGKSELAKLPRGVNNWP